jgi:uncharacterized SAM-dependent methyltransferase
MRLRALTVQVVRVAALDLTVHFAHREDLRTADSDVGTTVRFALPRADDGGPEQ